MVGTVTVIPFFEKILPNESVEKAGLK
jgi:hypothetical protein